MPALAAPLAADKLSAWEDWIAELNGERKAEFEDMNARHGLSEHRAYLQPTPDGSYLVLAIHEGPGAEDFLGNLAQSEHEFDGWFLGSVARLHGINSSEPLPPMASRRL
jgi:hypothetical protein